MSAMRSLRHSTFGVLISGLLLAACGSTTTPLALVGRPTLNISVPLSLSACDAIRHCYSVGTTGLDASPSSAGQVATAGHGWRTVAVPSAPSTEMAAASCWNNGCLFGGADSAGDVIWHTSSPRSITVSGEPTGGRGVSTISCFIPHGCAVVDTDPSGFSRLIFTSDGGATWTTPLRLPWSQNASALSMHCDNTLDCLIVGTLRGTSSSTAVTLQTRDGGRTFASDSFAHWAQLSNLSCFNTNCVALGSLSDGTGQIVVSTTRGVTWSAARLGPSRSIGAVSCQSASRCVAVGAGSARLWVSKGSTWNVRALRYVPDAFTSVSCSTRDCVAISSQTVVAISR